MNSSGCSQLLQVLRGRRHTIADRWYRAIAPISHMPHGAAEVREHLDEWTEEAIALLFTEPFEHGRAEAIGASLASLHCVAPDVLSNTQEVLTQQLVEELSADQVVALQPRLAALLGGVAAGFFDQAREITLAEQERIRGAMVVELRRMGEALRRSRDELEQRVEERTAELSAANEQLNQEITERVRAEKEIKRRNAELVVLNAIAATVNRSLDLEEVLGEALDKVLETMGWEMGAIHLLNERGSTLDLKVHRGVDLSPRMLEDISRVNLADGPMAEAIATGEPLIVDISAYPIVELIGRRDLKSLAMIPLKSKGRVFGIMEVVGLDSRPFTPEAIRLLASIGHQMGVAVENARLYGDLERRLEQLAALADQGRAISSTLDLDEILRTAVARTAQAMEARICTIRLVEGDHLNIGVAVGYRDEAAREHPIPIDERLARIVRDGQPLVIPDIEADAGLPPSRRERMRREGVRAYMGIPMMARGRPTGILSIYREEPHAWVSQEVAFASTIASHVATAVEKARLHKAVLEERGRTQAMLASITDGLCVTDPKGTVVAFNAGAERITGWRAKEIVGKSCCELFRMKAGETGSLCDEGECLVQQVVEKQHPLSFWNGGKQVSTREGSKVPVAVTISPLLLGEEGVSGAVVAFWDISREVEVERLKEEFLSLISHALRAPLTNIKAAAQLLLGDRGPLGPGVQEGVLGSIVEECDRLNRWVGRILDLSRLEADQMDLTRAPIALVPLVEKTLYLYERRSSLHSYEVWAPPWELWVLGDEGQLLAVLNELLDNAVKYSPEGGRIWVEIEEGEDVHVISVSDEGRGIPPQDLDRIFQKFYRVEKDDPQTIPGYGLGMYMARKLVEAHGGEIWAESREGCGSRFSFTLPRA